MKYKMVFINHIQINLFHFIKFVLVLFIFLCAQKTFAVNKTFSAGETLALTTDVTWDNLFSNTTADNWVVIKGPHNITVTGKTDIQFVSFQNTGSITFENDTIVKHCVFDGNASIAIGNTAALLSLNIIIEDSDFRNQTSKIAFSVSSISGDSAAAYRIKGNSFYYSTPKVAFLKHRNGCQFTENVVYNMELGNLKNSGYHNIGGSHTYSSNFFSSGKDVMDYRTLTVNFRRAPILFNNNYCYYDFHNPHPFTRTGSGVVGTDRYTNNILEVTYNFDGANIFNSNTTRPVDVSHNIHIGSGSLCNAVGNDARQPVTLNNNTCYSKLAGNSNDGMLFLSEGGVNDGTIHIFNNIVTGSTNPGAAVGSNSSVQLITSSDYNAFYKVSTPYDNVRVETGLTNDIATEDPAFIDPARNLFSWDISKGGVGTKSSVISSLSKINGYNETSKLQSDQPSGYTPKDLIDWVRHGFIPTNTALQASGKGGEHIGAASPFSSNTVSSITIDVPVITDKN